MQGNVTQHVLIDNENVRVIVNFCEHVQSQCEITFNFALGTIWKKATAKELKAKS
jgi:hypothetical protein